MIKSIIGGLAAATVIVFGMKALADSEGKMQQLGFVKICTLTEEYTNPVYKWRGDNAEPTIEWETGHMCVHEIWVNGPHIVSVGEEEKYLASRSK